MKIIILLEMFYNNFFHIYLSSTHAKLSVRLEVISELLQSSKKDRKEIGLKLIDEILHYGSFFASPLLDCGSQIRDYGLEPNGKGTGMKKH